MAAGGARKTPWATFVARARYRVGQFWRGLAAQVTADEVAAALTLLPAAARPLFTAMPVDAQRHSLDVWAALGPSPSRELAAAALLHDCGKVAAAVNGVRLGLWLRGPLVLADALWPGLTATWAVDDPARGWRYLLHVQHAHPAIGAAWAAAAGCAPLTCWLIAQHQTPLAQAGGDATAQALLAALQAADGGH